MFPSEVPTPSTEAHFNAVVTPGTASVKPQLNLVVWQNTVTVTMRDVWLQYLTLRLQGTIDRARLRFFRFYLDGEQYGQMILSTTNDTVSFDFGQQPVKLEAGNRVMRVKADLLDSGKFHFRRWIINVFRWIVGKPRLPSIGGSFHFFLESPKDFSLLDSDWLPIALGIGSDGEEFRPLGTGVQEVA